MILFDLFFCLGGCILVGFGTGNWVVAVGAFWIATALYKPKS